MMQQWRNQQFNEAALVDVHAAWCGPCRSQGPIVDALAGEYDVRASVDMVARRLGGLTDAARQCGALDAATA